MALRGSRTLCVAVRGPAEESDHSSTLDRPGSVEPAEAPADCLLLCARFWVFMAFLIALSVVSQSHFP